MENKIYLFRNRCEYFKILTKDDVINIIGEFGSLKDTLLNSYRKNKNYIVISLDNIIFDKCVNEKEKQLKKLFDKKSIDNVDIMYKETLKYVNSKNKKCVIEGKNLIYIDNLNIIKGRVIVERTNTLRCYFNIVMSDYKNPKLNVKESIKQFFISMISRLNIIFNKIDIENFIKKLDNYKE